MVQEQMSEGPRPWRLGWPEPMVLTVAGEDIEAHGIGRDEEGSYLILEDGTRYRLVEFALSASSAIQINLEAMNFREAFAKTKVSPWRRARMREDHHSLVAGQEVEVWKDPEWAHYNRTSADTQHPASANKWGVRIDIGMGWCRTVKLPNGKGLISVPEHKMEILP